MAFSAATSIATIGLYISYGIPIALRVVYRDRFVRGPFHLGAFSYPVAVVAVLWIGFISIAFILPTANPVDSQTLNYTIVAVGIILAYCLGFWVLSARKWFTGPIKQMEGERLSRGEWERANWVLGSGAHGHRRRESCGDGEAGEGADGHQRVRGKINATSRTTLVAVSCVIRSSEEHVIYILRREQN